MKEGIRKESEREKTERRKKSDSETDCEKHAGFNKERWRNDGEAGRCEEQSCGERKMKREEKKRVSSNKRQQGEVAHYRRSQTRRRSLKAGNGDEELFRTPSFIYRNGS